MNDVFHEPASPKLARLREVANERGIDTRLLDKLVGLLQSPGSLIRFSVVVSNLSAALDEAETTWNGILARLDLSWLPTILKELVPVAAVLNNDDQRASRRVGDPEEKLLTEHPLYMAFAQRSEHGPRQLRNYRKLQAHHFFGHLKAGEPSEGLSETKKERISKDAPYKAGLGVRALSGTDRGHKREVAEILVNLPLELPPDQFAESARIELNLELGNKGFVWSQQYVDYIAVFLEQAYGKEEPRKRNVHLRTTSGETGDQDDPHYNFGRVFRWSTGDEGTDGGNGSGSGGSGGDPGSGGGGNGGGSGGGERERQALDNDNCPDEDEDDEGFGWEDSSKGFEDSPGSFEAAMLAHHNQLIRDNKMFPFGYRALLASELFEIDVAARMSAWQHLEERSEKKAEIEILLLVMLWTASDEERASQLVWIRDEADHPECGLAMLRADVAKFDIDFRIRVPFPRYAHQQDHTEQSRKPNEFLVVPDHAGLGYLIDALFRRRCNAPGNTSPLKFPEGTKVPVFPDDLEEYRKSLKKLLKETDPSGRLTVQKIRDALFTHMIARTGKDIVAASMISEKEHYLAKVPMFYACRRLSKIQEIYADSVSSLRADILPKKDPSFFRSRIWSPAPETRFVTKRLCPRTDVVQDAVRRLRSDLEKTPITSDEVVRYHNRYTLYTIWYFAYSTGVRAIRTPYVDVEEISRLGMVVIRDKDSDAGFKAKLLWIPPGLREQMDKYKEASSPKKLTNQPKQDLPCFLIGEDPEVRPGTQSPRMGEYLPGFPVGVHRRFMFNALLDSGCPPEIVRIWMGHSSIGDEGWARHSTFSYARYREILGNYLVPILDELGFKPIESRL